jgi:hypothetical protein
VDSIRQYYINHPNMLCLPHLITQGVSLLQGSEQKNSLINYLLEVLYKIKEEQFTWMSLCDLVIAAVRDGEKRFI